MAVSLEHAAGRRSADRAAVHVFATTSVTR